MLWCFIRKQLYEIFKDDDATMHPPAVILKNYVGTLKLLVLIGVLKLCLHRDGDWVHPKTALTNK